MIRVEFICLAALDIHLPILGESDIANVTRQRFVAHQVEAEEKDILLGDGVQADQVGPRHVTMMVLGAILEIALLVAQVEPSIAPLLLLHAAVNIPEHALARHHPLELDTPSRDIAQVPHARHGLVGVSRYLDQDKVAFLNLVDVIIAEALALGKIEWKGNDGSIGVRRYLRKEIANVSERMI
jgi:hypothetical protein